MEASHEFQYAVNLKDLVTNKSGFQIENAKGEAWVMT